MFILISRFIEKIILKDWLEFGVYKIETDLKIIAEPKQRVKYALELKF